MSPEAVLRSTVSKVFKYVDTDEDGQIDKDELVRTHPCPPLPLHPPQADTDAD